MPRARVGNADKPSVPSRVVMEARADFLKAGSLSERNVQGRRRDAEWPPVPDLFDIIAYFRARGDSFTLIASVGFWIGADRKKALTAQGLKLWYEGELARRAAARATIR